LDSTLPIGRRAPLHGLLTMIALVAAYTAANLSWCTQPFQFTVLATGSGFGAVAAGWILSAEIGLAALVSMGLGYFSHARTTRRSLAAGTLLCLAGNVATVLVTAFPATLLCRMVAGIGEGLLIANVNVAVARLDDPEKRYGHINGLMNLIGFLVIVSMPLALKVLQVERSVFALIAVATLLCLGALLVYPAAAAAPGQAAPSGIGGWRGWTVYAAVLVSSTGVSSFYPVTESLGRSAGIPEAALDSALSMAYIGAIIGSYEGAWVDARLGRRGGALLVGIGLTAAVTLLVHAQGAWGFGAGMFLFGLFWFHGFVTCLGLAAEVDPAGGCAAACGGAFLLGGGIGPVLGGYELEWNGGAPQVFAWSVAVLMAAFVLAVWQVNRRAMPA
jgi:predicted MFS family arabinose efflux permease